MSECDQVKLLLGPFDDGELEPHEMEEVALHIVSCDRCKVTLGDYRSLGVALRDSILQPAIDGFTAGVLKRIEQIPQPWWMRWRIHLDTLKEHIGATVPLVAAGAFVAILTAWLVTPYAQHVLHRPSNPDQVASRDQNDLTAATSQVSDTSQSAAADQSDSSMIALSNDPTTTVIWLPNQP
jgi:anti-sigma factor RsiW